MARWFIVLMAFAQLANADVGLYVGSLDPSTEAHAKAVLSAKRLRNLRKIYVMVNYATDKDFSASMMERIEMFRMAYVAAGGDLADIEVVREPLEGRIAYARYLLERHAGEKVLGIFRNDTFDKNFNIFAGEPSFDFIHTDRPEVATAEAATYEPIIWNMVIDADGVSSSEAKKRLVAGDIAGLKGILAVAVIDYARARKIYFPPGDPIAAEAAFEAAYRKFVSGIAASHPTIDYERLGLPKFKAGQSEEGQWDKYVRHVVDSTKMDVETQLVFRPKAERILGIRYATEPLRKAERAALYLGSFDPIDDPQAAVVDATLGQTGAGKVFVGVLERSRKPLVLPQQERVARARQRFAHYGDRVSVIPAPALDEALPFVNAMRAEFSRGLVLVFGANVYEANRTRFGSVRDVHWAVAPVPGFSLPLPQPDLTALRVDCAGGMAN